VVEGPVRAVLSVTREAKTPRLATAMGVMKAAKKPLTTWSLADLGLGAHEVGLSAARAKVVRVGSPERKKRTQVFEGPGGLSELTQKLAAKGLLS